jgi:hypothetical protein
MATCRWCRRPATPDRLDCPACDVRRALRPTMACALGHHADCVGQLGADARYVDPYGLRGEPCGCNCHAAEFDPGQVHPELHGPWATFLTAALVVAVVEPVGQLALFGALR